VLGQVARGQVERVTQITEVGSSRLRGDRQDAEPMALMNPVIAAVGRMGARASALDP
jgi:hypothetical protein